MKNFKVYFQLSSSFVVEAENKEEAEEIFKNPDLTETEDIIENVKMDIAESGADAFYIHDVEETFDENVEKNDHLAFFRGLSLDIKSTTRNCFLDSYETGESGKGRTTEYKEIDTQFSLSHDASKNFLKKIVVDELKESLNEYLSEDWIMAHENRIVIHAHEDEDGTPIKNVKKAFDDGEEVYSVYYDVELFLNGKQLMEPHLVSIFGFQS